MNICQKNSLCNFIICYEPNKLFIANRVNIKGNVKGATFSKVGYGILDFAFPSSATLSFIISNLKLAPTLVVTYMEVNMQRLLRIYIDTTKVL